MPYISSVERIGIKKGLEQGLEQGLRQGARRQLLRLLERRFGEVPAEVRVRLEDYDVEQLEELLDPALVVNALESS